MDSTLVAANVGSTIVMASVKSSSVVATVLPKVSSELTSRPSPDQTIKTTKSSSTAKFSEHIPDLGYLTLSPSSSLSKPTLMATTPVTPAISTSALLRPTVTSRKQIDKHSTTWSSPPSQTTELHATSASPSVTILNATVSATVFPAVQGNIQH